MSQTSSLEEREYTDWRGGILGNINDLKARVRHLLRANNVVFGDPDGALSVRKGYRRAIASTGMPDPGHSLMMFSSLASGEKCFAAAADKIYYVNPGGSYDVQSLPVTPSSRKWSSTSLNGALIATQEGGTNKPIAYDGTSWLSTTLPSPGAAPALTEPAVGVVGVGVHKVRTRFRFRQGTSIASAEATITSAGSKNIHVVLTAAEPTRSDYLGWTIEMTHVASATNWYDVADVAAATTTYDINSADVDLNDLIGAEPGLHGSLPHLEGLTVLNERLIGWNETDIYVGQLVGDAENSGIYNLRPTATFPVRKDDGDAIVTCLPVGEILFILKNASIHRMQGLDLTTYQVNFIGECPGPSNPRAAVAIGSNVYWYAGRGRMFVSIAGRPAVRVAEREVGQYLKDFNFDFDGDVVAVNNAQQYAEFWYTPLGALEPAECVRFNVARGRWEHLTGMSVAAAMVPKKRSLFSGAEYLFCGPEAVTPDAPDASGNPTFQCWRDQRGASTQVYIQKFSASGVRQWALDGIQVTTSTGSAQILDSDIIGLSDGGCIVVYGDNRGGTRVDVYIQMYNSSGVAQWAAGGIRLNDGTRACNQAISICDDLSGGAIAGWIEMNGASADYVYAQRVDSNGSKEWGAGVAVKVFDRNITGNGIMSNVVLVPRTIGTCWITANNANTTAGQRYQRLGNNGDALGTAMGDYIAGAAQNAFLPACRDASGGLMLAYTIGGDSFVRKITSAGAIAWTVNGTAGRAHTSLPQICTDGLDGCVLGWADTPDFTVYHMRAQRISAAGALQWSAGGVAVSAPATFAPTFHSIVSDGLNGAIVAYIQPGTNSILQRVSGAAGATLWGAGVQIGTTLTQPLLVTDGASGVVALAQAGATDLYAERVLSTGVPSWGAANSAPVVAAAGVQDLYRIAFTSTPQGEVPPAPATSYHVWSGFDGLMDAADADGTGGRARKLLARAHDTDDGAVRVSKVIQNIELHMLSGSLDANVSLILDGEEAAGGIAVPVETAEATWSDVNEDLDGLDVLVWDDGEWASDGPSIALAPAPPGSRCRKYGVLITADVTGEPVIGGYVLRYIAEPHWSLSR